jgi:hypothetical protein
MDKVGRCGCEESATLRAVLEQVCEDLEGSGPAGSVAWDCNCDGAPDGAGACNPCRALTAARAALSSVESEAQYAARSGPQPEPPVLGAPVPLFAPKPHHDCDGSCAKHRAGVGLDS